MTLRILAGIGAALLFTALAAVPGLAAGGGGDSGGGGGSGAAATQCKEGWVFDASTQTCGPCPDGTVYDADKKLCVAESTELLDDPTLYRVGHDLAMAGHYPDALAALSAIRDKNEAMVLTMIGYATRKLGRTEEGIAIYHQALAIDPGNLNTHEYLGEGYLAAGRVDLAEAELDTLQRLCGGTACEQYQDLQKAILGEPVWN